MERTRKTGDAVLIANAENSLKECLKEKDALEIFKKDLGTFVRFYEFISQIVPFDDLELEELSLFARKLRPMLREATIEEDGVDLDNAVLSHYRLSKIRQLNELFVMDELTDTDLVSFARTVHAKVRQNERAMMQLRNNTREQAMLGDFTGAVMQAIMDSGDSHQNQTLQVLGSPGKVKEFSRIIYDAEMTGRWGD